MGCGDDDDEGCPKRADREAPAQTCPTCNVPWVAHLGVAGTCRTAWDAIGECDRVKDKLKFAVNGLEVIRNWARFNGGELLKPKEVATLCEQTLKVLGSR